MHPQLLKHLKPLQTVFVATCEDDQPRLRPMVLIWHQERFYIATGARDAKCAQISANPKLEFCQLLQEGENNGYIRASALCRQVDDVAKKKEVADEARFIYHYWSDPADPDYRLYELIIKDFRYLEPGDDREQNFAI